MREQAPVVADKVADAARTATDKVTSAVSRSTDAGAADSRRENAEDRVEQAVQFQKDHGPKGPLP